MTLYFLLIIAFLVTFSTLYNQYKKDNLHGNNTRNHNLKVLLTTTFLALIGYIIAIIQEFEQNKHQQQLNSYQKKLENKQEKYTLLQKELILNQSAFNKLQKQNIDTLLAVMRLSQRLDSTSNELYLANLKIINLQNKNFNVVDETINYIKGTDSLNIILKFNFDIDRISGYKLIVYNPNKYAVNNVILRYYDIDKAKDCSRSSNMSMGIPVPDAKCINNLKIEANGNVSPLFEKFITDIEYDKKRYKRCAIIVITNKTKKLYKYIFDLHKNINGNALFAYQEFLCTKNKKSNEYDYKFLNTYSNLEIKDLQWEATFGEEYFINLEN